MNANGEEYPPGIPQDSSTYTIDELPENLNVWIKDASDNTQKLEFTSIVTKEMD